MVSLIVAYAKNKVIGNNGMIPWKIKGEQMRFKDLTVGHVVVMGRRTYEEIGKPLPGRTTIVISKTKQFDEENCITLASLNEALEYTKDKDVFISGGAKLYEEALDIVERMYITEIDADIEGDTYFPDFDQENFIKETNHIVDGEIPYAYVTYTRIEVK